MGSVCCGADRCETGCEPADDSAEFYEYTFRPPVIFPAVAQHTLAPTMIISPQKTHYRPSMPPMGRSASNLSVEIPITVPVYEPRMMPSREARGVTPADETVQL